MDMELKGSVCRIRECMFEFLTMEDDMIDDNEEISWDFMGRDVSLKSAFLFCDLNRIILSACDDDRKKGLVDLANRLFYCLEELGHDVKSRNISETQLRYEEASFLLQELMVALLICSQ